MITFEIKPPKNLREIAAKLSAIPGGMERAGRSAVNRTLKGGRQDASRKIGQRYTIPVALVMSTIKTRVAGMTGEMASSGARLPSDKFLHRPTVRQNPGPPGGIFLNVVKGQGGNLRRAFIQRTGGIWERVGRSRFPIRRFYSPSAPGMLAVKPVSSYIVAKMEERLGINLAHEAAAVINGFL